MHFLTGAQHQPVRTPRSRLPDTTWVCAKDGYFGMLWGCNAHLDASATPHLFFVLDRSRDPSGVGTGNGLYWVYHNGQSGVGLGCSYSLDRAAAENLMNGGGNCLVPATPPHHPRSRRKTKLFPHRVFTPDEYAITGCMTYLGIEITQYTEFDVAPLPGMAAQRYLAAGLLWDRSRALRPCQLWLLAMRYET